VLDSRQRDPSRETTHAPRPMALGDAETVLHLHLDSKISRMKVHINRESSLMVLALILRISG
jgi:hypothetical protein